MPRGYRAAMCRLNNLTHLLALPASIIKDWKRQKTRNYFMRRISTACRLSILCAITLCSGCAVVAVADAVVTTGAVIVKTGVKAIGAVVNAVIPSSTDK